MGYAELSDQMANSRNLKKKNSIDHDEWLHYLKSCGRNIKQLLRFPFKSHMFHNLADLVAQLQTLLD
jgi:hypothetical protein